MTEAELIDYIVLKYKQKIEVRYIKAEALAKGYTEAQIAKAFEEAHIKIQQKSDRDPAIRLILGPALVYIGGTIFYLQWAMRVISINFIAILGAICLFLGIKMIISLIKQWRK